MTDRKRTTCPCCGAPAIVEEVPVPAQGFEGTMRGTKYTYKPIKPKGPKPVALSKPKADCTKCATKCNARDWFENEMHVKEHGCSFFKPRDKEGEA